jgi:hypothetical protein
VQAKAAQKQDDLRTAIAANDAIPRRPESAGSAGLGTEFTMRSQRLAGERERLEVLLE